MDPHLSLVTLPPSLNDDDLPGIAEPLRELARSGHVRQLTLDAKLLSDISARGLGVLVAVSRIAGSRGARVQFLNVDQRLMPLFDAARLDVDGAPSLSSRRLDG